MPNTPAIRAEGVRKRFGHVQALRAIDVHVEPGQIFGLIGANGAGKSTFIRLLIGASQADGGSLQALGMDPLHQKAALRERLGYMPQSPALYEDLTAAENVRFFARAHKLVGEAARVEETLDFVQLSERADDAVSTLSGGMKQRVSLACALVHRPPLLLLDEPTAGVDLKLRSAFWQHFKQLAAQGITILVSTHQMDEAVHCDRLAIISEGSIVANDTPHGMLQGGDARLSVWHGDKHEQLRLPNYPVDLPKALQAYGLDSRVTRIELETTTLETTVLELISKGKQ